MIFIIPIMIRAIDVNMYIERTLLEKGKIFLYCLFVIYLVFQSIMTGRIPKRQIVPIPPANLRARRKMFGSIREKITGGIIVHAV